ncbi:hypothetical protein ACLOAU_16275 [Niabella sp. CJ426]|uniref:hypothetical protein n=1 Tax=Niabella sp. CJ426 TaxID=3393740 RepID=UPI003D0735DB
MEKYQVIVPGFDAYMSAANQTANALLASDSDLVAGIRHFDEFYRNKLVSNNSQMGPIGMFLFHNAYTCFLSAVRMALSGHTASVFPLLRTALESACYAVIVESDPELAQVWIDRHKGDAERKACGRKFTVKNARDLIKRKMPSFDSLIGELYDSAIDFGAHPNIRSVFGHVTIDSDTYPEHCAISLASLYGENHHETHRGLLACLDFGFFIFVIAVLTPQEINENLLEDTLSLNNLKESIAEKYCSYP